MTHREITTEIGLPANCCAGHFPGRPLVPGVLQLLFVERALADAAAEYVLNFAGGCWVAAFLLFSVIYFPILTGPAKTTRNG